MELSKFLEIYWNYYTQLETDFFALEPFCAIDKENENTFSTNYLKLILSICGEIDTICKRMCIHLDPDLKKDTCGINDYKAVLMAHYSKIADEKVIIQRHDFREIQPWKAWAHKHTPHWWSTYNKVKHHRDEVWNNKESYKYANQKTAIDALCALYIILEYWAAYNYVLTNQHVNSYEMVQIRSRRLSIIEWENFYETFMSLDFFESEKCRTYLGAENVALV